MRRENFVILNRVPRQHRVARRLYDEHYDTHNADHYYLDCAIAYLVRHVDIDMDEPGFERELMTRHLYESGSIRNPRQSQVEELVVDILAKIDKVYESGRKLGEYHWDEHRAEFELKRRYMNLFGIVQNDIDVFRILTERVKSEKAEGE